MFIDIDYDKRKKGYKINLAKPNQQTIASISEAYGANYSIKLGNINEVTFNVPYFIDKLDERVKNENIELIKEKMYTKISYNNNDEWMVIDSIEDVGSGDEKYMTVTAFTNVYETSNRKINELNLEIVNPEEYYDEVLNDVAWSIGTIDPLFKNIYRSVELSNVTVLEAIITGAETFGAVLDFDTENKKINLIDMDSRAKYRGLNINYSNFLQSINRKRSVDEMTTRLYVYGSEDLSIESVNPTGMRYLEDFTYFLYPFERDENKNVIKSSHYMSDELAHAILDKNELSKEYQPQIKAMQEEIDEETIEYINETTLLNELRFDEMSVSGLLDIAKATEDNDLILQRQGELAEIKTKITIKELTVDHISATIEDLERQVSQLQSQISVTSFSKELYDELSMYIIESEFRDDRYIDEEELYRDALKKFDESKSPSVVIEASIDNIIDSLEEDYYSDKVVLGDIARVTDKEMSVEMKSLIVELSFDLDNNTCDVTIANGDIEKDGYDRILSVLYDTQSTTTMLENNKYKWDTVTDVKTEVDLMRDGEIDATRNRIKAGFRESVTIEDRGIVLSNPDFPDEIVIMQAGVIALSTDGGENWSTSITPRGVVAETIIGRLVASNNLIVTNDSGSFRIDGEGLTVDMDSIKIMSGEGDTPENIVDSWNEMLITMDEFADDGKLNEYEKNQIARQWNSIAIAHSSMVDAIQNAYGPETPENPYPAEYEVYMESYEGLRSYLNDEIQSDGHTILDPLNRSETTDIDSDKYNRLVSDYEVNKDRFQTVIPLEFSQTFIEQTRKEISLNYVQNGEVATKLNLSEEGVRIDGRLLEVNSETHFNDDLVMNAGLIRSADGAINIDLNAGVINLSRPLTINAFPVATEEFVEESLSDAVKDIDVEYGITSDKNTPPSDWNTTPPAWQDGKYIWSRTITVYKNGVTEITEPVNITGATGSSGGTGQSGRSVKNIQEQYYLSTSPLDLENGSWVDNPPEWEADKYIWTRSVITYENPSGVDRTEPISVSGQQGPKGETGSDGKDAPLVKLSGKTQIIKQDSTGRLTPASNFTVTGSSVNTTINSWRYSTDGGDFITSPPVGVTRSVATITVNPTLVEFNTLTIRASDGKVSDDFTIARAVDGATGEDAYTVILTNESHTFAGNIFSAVPSSTTADIIAYKGDVRVPVKVDSITGTPIGMSAEISSNGTINTRVTFTVDEKLVDESGTVKLNLVLSGNFITKEFSFAVAYKGERGEKGERGATGNRGPQGDEGVGISSVTEHYLVSNQSTGVTYSTSGWGTSVPTMTPDLRFLWNYEEIHFTDGTSEPTLPVVVGVYGQQGPKGSEGEDGRSIENIEERYLATSSGSGVTRSTSGWKEEMQVTTPTKKYLWNYEIITWSKAPLKTYVEPIIIGIHGDKGETGERGPRGLEGQQGPEGKQGIQGPEGKDGMSTYTHIAYATSKTGANFEHSTFDDATYIGMYVSNESDSSDSPADYEWTLIKGKDGSQGLRGPEGKDGRTPYFHTAWANNSTGTSEFSTTVSTNKLYIGTATTFEKDDPTEPSAYIWTKIKGDKGDKGDEGTGVSDVSVRYQNHSNGTTAPTGNWSNSPNPVKGTYLWARTTTSYTDGEEITTYNVSYNATDGQRGPQGPQGGTGTDGTGVSGTEVRYSQSASGTTTPTSGWQTTPHDPIQGQYNWTRTIVNYTDGTKSTSYSTSYNAKDGVKGDKGDEGKGILSTAVTYQNHTNGTTAPTGTWNGTIPTPVKGQYLWTRTVTKYTEGDPITTYSVSYYAKDGQKGDTGETGLKGDEGTGVNTTTVRYSQSTSGTNVPASPWDVNPPTPIQGQYNWTRTVITYTDGSSSTAYSTSYNAKDGKKGDKGEAGKGIKSQVVTYQNHSNGTTAPTGTWTDSPSPVKGEYLWTRTVTQYTEGNPITTYAVAYNALDGQRGATGGKGDEGTGISSTVIRYFQSTSGTTTPTGNGATTPPTPIQGQYNWTRTVITYTDGTKSTAWSTSYNAKDGQKGDTGPTGSTGPKGDAGKGITDQTVTYQNHTNGTTAPTGSWSSSPSPVKGRYLWTRTITTYTEGNPVTTYAVAYNATDGQNGSEGTGISSTQVRYQQSTSGSATPTGTWQTSIPTPTKGRYLWTRTIITYTDGTSSTSYSTSYYATDGQKGDKGDTGDRGPQGPQGATGEQGPIGNTGTSVESITEYYLATSVSSGIKSSNSGFRTTMQPMTSTNKYLWNYEKINFSDGTSQPTIPVIIGVYGDKGEAGDTGRSIVSITEHYLVTSASSGVTRSTSGWSTSMKPTTETNRYLWNYETIKWSSGTLTTYVDPIIIGVHGAKGPQGPQGVSITKVDVEYAQNASETSAPTSGWSTNAPTWKNGQYIWSRTKTTYSSGNPTYSKPACITGQKGSVGGVGNDGKGISSIVEQYYLSDSKETRTGGNWTTTVPKWEQGKYMWTRSQINWINPTGTTYTDPIVDSAWEAMEDGLKGVGLADKTEILSGTEIYTDKADDDSAVHVEIDGKSVQSIDPNAKNMVPTEYDDWMDGYHYSMQDGEPQPYTNRMAVPWLIEVEPSKSYYIDTGNPSVYYVIRTYDSNITIEDESWGGSGSSGVKTTNSTTKYLGVGLYTSSTSINITNEFKNGDIKPLIQENSIKDRGWRDYIQESPKPQKPMKIHSVSDFSLVSAKGKENILINGNFEDGLNKWINMAGDIPSIESLSYTKHKMLRMDNRNGSGEGYIERYEWVTPNQEYTFSWTQQREGRVIVEGVDINNKRRGYFRREVNKSGSYTRFHETFTMPSDVYKVRIVLHFSARQHPLFMDLKLEKGGLSPYMPHTSEIEEGLGDYGYKASFSLSEPIRSVGNVKDKIFRNDDGRWGVERLVRETVLDGSENWKDRTTEVISFENVNWYQHDIRTDNFVRGVGLNSHFSRVSSTYTEDIPHVRIDGGNGTIWLGVFPSKNMHSNLTEFKNWLKSEYDEGRPFTTHRVLSTPVIEWLDSNVTDTLNNIVSFSDDNYVFSTVDLEYRGNLLNRASVLLDTRYDNTSPIEVPRTTSGAVGHSATENAIPVRPNQELIMEKNSVSIDQFWRIVYVDKSNNPVERRVSTSNRLTQIVPKGAYGVRVSFPSDSNAQIHYVPDDKAGIISERLKPALHATFKGGGWYSRWKTEDEFEKHQRELDEKADTDLIDNIQTQLDDFILVEGYEEEIGEINKSLQDYRELIESGEVATEEAVKDIGNLLKRTEAVENNFGEFTESWNFEVTAITMGEEGLFIGDNITDMGIRIAPATVDKNGNHVPPRIDFVDNGAVVAVITGQYMRINRGIFVKSAQIGEHQIETIAGGHTIFSWIPS